MKRYALLLLAVLALSCNKDGIGENPVSPDPVSDPGNTTVIYEANERLFNKSGALKDIESSLDRIGGLGVNVLWLMPVQSQGVKDAFGSPYCIRNYTEVNSDYGTLDDLKSLVKSAHAKGIKVILDWIANHTSWDNVWITEHPDWYTQENGKIISPKGMGWSDVADLNYSSKEMRAAMTDAMLYWIKEADVDGFRCDYTDGVPADFWKECFQTLRAQKEDLLLLGESKDTKFYDSGFDLLYGWDYASKLPKVYSGTLGVANLYDCVQNEGDARMRYTRNHDTASESASTTLYKSADGELSAFALTLFLGGVPMIYSSQEAGYTAKINFFNWVTVDWNAGKSYTEKYSALVKAYIDSAPGRCGEPSVSSSDKVAIIRYTGGSDTSLYVLVNTGSSKAKVKTNMNYAGSAATDLIGGSGLTLPSSIELEPYGYAVYEIKK